MSHLPIIGLAKRHEDIVTDEDHLPRTIRLNLILQDDALSLLRDEAHRYALSYLKIARKTNPRIYPRFIPGMVTKKKSDIALLWINPAFKKADVKELANVPGIGRKTAEQIIVG